jgi:MSHA biogenesis protein MshI
MKSPSLFSRFSSSSGRNKQLRVVIQVDAIYLSSSNVQNEEPLVFPIDSDWHSALRVALNSLNGSRYNATVVFCSHYYQSFQIDKPELPKEEWPVALPFLLKDLINERVTEVVADALLLPDGKRAQAYVLSKTHLNPLVEILKECNVSLARVLPEDEVWGHVQSDFDSFMLLYRSVNDSYKVGAYVNTNNRFQRVIRGIIPPLTGVASSELQLDSIALELQRSIDYLSSQLRDTSINHLLVLCDEDNTDELVYALSERLSTKVSSLFEHNKLQCGQVLCSTISLLDEKGINLYPSHLKPKKEYFTLNAVACSWLILILLMGGYYGYKQFELSGLNATLNQKQQTKDRLAQEFDALTIEVASHKPKPSLLKAIERLKLDIESKKATLSAIDRFDDALKEGYSGVMNSLAMLGRNDISITHIELNEKTLNLKGLARTPSSIPKWVKQFRTELNLVGRTFESMSIGRDENDVVTFELVTKIDSADSVIVGGLSDANLE